MINYERLLEEATEIAEGAAQVALSYFRKSALLIEVKKDLSPVTIADRKTEQRIREELEKRFPEHGIIGEELGSKTEDAEFVWTIDPIDGTRSFVRGIPLFGTLLGLLCKGEPVLGVMVLPALDETYMAAKDQGAYCNGQRLHVSTTTKLETAVIACGDICVFEQAGKKTYHSNLVEQAELVRGYSDCFGHSLVIRGAVDAMIDPIVSPWDIIPVACLIREAGGEYFDFEGENTVRGSSFISCAPGLRKPLLQLG